MCCESCYRTWCCEACYVSAQHVLSHDVLRHDCNMTHWDSTLEWCLRIHVTWAHRERSICAVPWLVETAHVSRVSMSHVTAHTSRFSEYMSHEGSICAVTWLIAVTRLIETRLICAVTKRKNPSTKNHFNVTFQLERCFGNARVPTAWYKRDRFTKNIYYRLRLLS